MLPLTKVTVRYHFDKSDSSYFHIWFGSEKLWPTHLLACVSFSVGSYDITDRNNLRVNEI